MKNNFITVYEKNVKADKINRFKLEIAERHIEAFEKSLISNDTGERIEKRFFNIEDTFISNKPGYKGYILGTTGYIGIFSFPENPPIVIEPKVDRFDFFNILRNVNLEKYFIFKKIISGMSKNDNFYEGIIHMFLIELKIILKNPIQKFYKPRVEIRDNIKGKILISESLKDFKFLSGKFICEYEQFTQNSLHNQIIKYTLYILQFISHWIFQRQIKEHLQNFKDVSLVKIQDFHFSKLDYNRFTKHYVVVHDFCHMIIKSFSFGRVSGEYNAYSLLFYASSIYEIYLRNLLREMLSPDNFKVEKGKYKKVQPDIIIKKNDRIVLICDAKYKLKFDRTADYREALDYINEYKKKARRKEIKFSKKHRKVILIYPLDGNRLNFLKAHFDLIKENKEDLIDEKFSSFDQYKELFNLFESKGVLDISNNPLQKDIINDFNLLSKNLFLMEKSKNELYYCYLIDLSQISKKQYLKNWIRVIKENFLLN